jgi:hypothetical protein
VTTSQGQPRVDLDDLRRRVDELLTARAVLLPDADDPRTLSELTNVEVQLAAARRELSAALPPRHGLPTQVARC